MEGGQCGAGGDGGEERGHAGSRFVVYSHEAAAEHRGRQREGVEKGRGKKTKGGGEGGELLPSGPRGS